MNKERRSQINKLIGRIIGELVPLLGEIKDEVETTMGDEQDYFDNIPESFQGGQKGDDSQEKIDALQTALDALQEAESALEDAVSGLDEAQG